MPVVPRHEHVLNSYQSAHCHTLSSSEAFCAHATTLPQELDGYKQQWFHEYLSSHPPSEGNKVRAAGATVACPLVLL